MTDTLKPYRVEPRHEGCPTCEHGEQFDIIGPGEVAQSQSWGDREEADFICELMNDAFAAGRASYAQQVLDTLKAEVNKDGKEQTETPQTEAEATPAPPPAADPDEIPF